MKLEVKYMKLEVKDTELDVKYRKLNIKNSIESDMMWKGEREWEKKIKKPQVIILAEIVFEAVYAMVTWNRIMKESQLNTIVSLQEKLENFACKSLEQVDEFVEVIKFTLL